VGHVVLIDGSGDGERVFGWDEFLARGAAHLAANPAVVREATARTTRDTLATLIYTSGTTGVPKGVELTHRNWVYIGFVVDQMRIISEDDLQYLWLPLSHVFGKVLLACQVAIGFSSAVDGRLDKIVPGLGEIRPTFMCGAPRIYEKVRAAVISGNAQGLKSAIAKWAFAVGRESNAHRLAERPMPIGLGLQYKIADRLVFSKLRHRLGGRIKFMVSGSAKLNSQVQSWFYSAGLLIIEGYGLTETTAVTFVNHPATPRLGTVGPVILGTEVQIAADGEVLVRGGGVMRGYHKAPDLTAEVIKDGWFHTGDIGQLDADGYLTLTDRKKDLMKTSGGKYVAPQKVEGAIVAAIPFISQAIAVGDGRNYISAILTLDRDNLAKWAAVHSLADRSYEQLTQSAEVRSAVQALIDTANGKLERWETVKKFTILDHEFTVDEGGVTPSMKLRRATITQLYAEVVNGMYPVEAE
jgi:long-chain acyl-CoA synthetase